ncbi:MAG TPA: MerR family transcriptional regulator [Nocardioidaceae bacterium]|nr:MerR family transcriptional regulator [Nocardioidaceae bacterium]
MSIGEVLRQLRPDFPDVSISKIRFLEAEGLVEPERSPSGYRKFSSTDLKRLQYILTAQRDHYLPLKVIRQHLEAMERGLEPPATAGGSPRVPESVHTEDHHGDGGGSGGSQVGVRISTDELLANSGLSSKALDELKGFGLLRPIGDTDYFDADALVVATTVVSLARYGLEPRHLRVFKSAADREFGVIEQIVRPVARQRDDASKTRAAEMTADLATLSVRLHAALVRGALRELL